MNVYKDMKTPTVPCEGDNMAENNSHKICQQLCNFLSYMYTSCICSTLMPLYNFICILYGCRQGPNNETDVEAFQTGVAEKVFRITNYHIVQVLSETKEMNKYVNVMTKKLWQLLIVTLVKG